MTTVRVIHGIDDLFDDLRAIPVKAAKEMQTIVRDGARAGNMLAKDFARESAGSHGKLYHRAFSTTVNRPTLLIGGGTYSSEYGPDAAKPQGNMSFEFGSRNQRPHLDLARSADIVGPILGQEVRQMFDRLFW